VNHKTTKKLAFVLFLVAYIPVYLILVDEWIFAAPVFHDMEYGDQIDDEIHLLKYARLDGRKLYLCFAGVNQGKPGELYFETSIDDLIFKNEDIKTKTFGNIPISRDFYSASCEKKLTGVEIDKNSILGSRSFNFKNNVLHEIRRKELDTSVVFFIDSTSKTLIHNEFSIYIIKRDLNIKDNDLLFVFSLSDSTYIGIDVPWYRITFAMLKDFFTWPFQLLMFFTSSMH
jgi:hypothetical protein